MQIVNFGTTTVGNGYPPYVIAEIGANHNGDMDLCRRLIRAAAEAGANAVKFQSWTEETLISEDEYERNTEYSDKKKHFGSLREMVREYQLTTDQHHQVLKHCTDVGVEFCSSVFSNGEADLLDELDVPFYKMASMDINNLPLLSHVAAKKRPIIVSTGMATLAEIEQAVRTIKEAGNDQIVLLHCVSIYPPDPEIVNLRNMDTLRTAFDVPVGFSDHTLGTSVPIAAIARGACIIEKHFTLDKSLPGWDHSISANPEELRYIVEEGQKVQKALGTTVRSVSSAEINKRRQFRRSATAKRDLPAGLPLTASDIAFKRPGTGVAPDEWKYAEGSTLNSDIKEGHIIRWDDIG